MATLNKVKEYIAMQFDSELICVKEAYIDGKGWIPLWDTEKYGKQSEESMLRHVDNLILAGATNFAFEYKSERYDHPSIADFSVSTLMIQSISPIEEESVEDASYEFRFNGCKHLDYRPVYSAKRQVFHTGGLFWLRGVHDNPRMVQFCLKKGRLTGCEACSSESNKQCNDYEEVIHIVKVPKIEFNS